MTLEQTKQMLKYHAERKLTPDSVAIYNAFTAVLATAKPTEVKSVCKQFEDMLMASACDNFLDNKISTGTFESF